MGGLCNGYLGLIEDSFSIEHGNIEDILSKMIKPNLIKYYTESLNKSKENDKRRINTFKPNELKMQITDQKIK